MFGSRSEQEMHKISLKTSCHNRNQGGSPKLPGFCKKDSVVKLKRPHKYRWDTLNFKSTIIAINKNIPDMFVCMSS